jgi:hypothetical protein
MWYEIQKLCDVPHSLLMQSELLSKFNYNAFHKQHKYVLEFKLEMGCDIRKIRT